MPLTEVSPAEIPAVTLPDLKKQVNAPVRVCIVQDSPHDTAATFLRTQAENLPARVLVVHGVVVPQIDGRPLLGQSFAARASRKLLRRVLRREWDWELTWGYLKAFRKFRPQAVLAQFGGSGVRVRAACRLAGVPLIAHFHGVDASQHQYLEANAQSYPLLFRDAAAVIGVSQAMCRQLVHLGAPEEKVHYSPCGVNCQAFGGATPGEAPPVFLATGRFVDKKAPHLTLLAFSRVHQTCPDARLLMIGDGPLLGACRDLVVGMGLGKSVEFLGTRSPREVQESMRQARGFVQHSVVAADGDSEGTPVAIIEAGASGLPVVATRHAGIPDVVVEGSTGFLVDERDVEGMAGHMIRLARDAELSARLGRAAQERIKAHFSLEANISRLWGVIKSCIRS
jgi:colanic acid/amylovoran biosynthesis glycosyltransferase